MGFHQSSLLMVELSTGAFRSDRAVALDSNIGFSRGSSCLIEGQADRYSRIPAFVHSIVEFHGPHQADDWMMSA
jgi:hypothetical protein